MRFSAPILFKTQGAPASPPAGDLALYPNSTTGNITQKKSNGAVADLTTGPANRLYARATLR